MQHTNEQGYLELIKDIISNGDLRQDRTQTGTIGVFGRQIRFNLNDQFPLLTTKRVFFKGVLEELLWFIRGSTNSKELSDKGVKIWDGNGSRQFLDSRKLYSNEEFDLGPVYGFQWRHFGAKYVNMHKDYTGEGVDQLQTLIDGIRNDPFGRRHVLSAWNPVDIDKMALPPCHVLVQFFVSSKMELSCQLYQRSADVGLGVPFNIASYALLAYMVAHVLNLKLGEFVHTFGDCHIYVNHLEQLKEQIKREPKEFPKLLIKRKVTSIDDFKYDDFELVNYCPHPKIDMPLSV